MSERLYTHEEGIRSGVLGLIEDTVSFAVEHGLATKAQVREAVEDALAVVIGPEPGDPGLRWGFGFPEDERGHDRG